MRQGSYSQDQVTIDMETQRRIATTVEGARGERVRLPDVLGGKTAIDAYLGHVDVRALDTR